MSGLMPQLLLRVSCSRSSTANALEGTRQVQPWNPFSTEQFGEFAVSLRPPQHTHFDATSSDLYLLWFSDTMMCVHRRSDTSITDCTRASGHTHARNVVSRAPTPIPRSDSDAMARKCRTRFQPFHFLPIAHRRVSEPQSIRTRAEQE